MLLPSDIVTEVEQILQKFPNYLSAYQILERLPAALRDQIIEERGMPGQNNGNSYTAAKVVTDAAQMLHSKPGFDSLYCDGGNLLFEIAGHVIRAGNSACAFYRIKPLL